ncbi:hypothetical protein INS49_008328 [Diaporthe citri]|uniref:uncharacterized protein n=1 Tax=Diaporthe citri TaxID=83186 RepID=UPI001C7FBCE5|nr:uncharacterized protein INS49_008328 [Diaporthe citri]KAG6363232.1 hypothetical protein INS49_008328 [Diaporthe citri]
MRSVALACLAPLAAATKNIVGLSYADAIPKENLAQDCEYPAYFTIQSFTTFTPSASNNTEVNFGCAAARYACDNSSINFIWQNNKLTMIELACPTSSVQYDTSGSWIPTLTCTDVTDESGVKCASNQTTYQGQFTSIEPLKPGGGGGPGPTRLIRRA